MGSTGYCYDLFYLYQDSPWRRIALSNQKGGSPDKFLLYGLEHFQGKGFRLGHNLNRISGKTTWVWLNWLWTALGGYGGEFGTVWASRRDLKESKAIISTTDRVGIPLVLLKWAGIIHNPILYVSIGLPERLEKLKNSFMKGLYRSALLKTEKIVCYGFEECARLRSWLGDNGSRVEFMPFGVDPEVFHPLPEDHWESDVISVGADPHRDFMLLYQLAESRKDLSMSLITTPQRAALLGPPPSNLKIMTNISPRLLLYHLARARTVVLPVKENCYSGATTSLLQAMAMAKPVVVSSVGAIREGYHLVDGVNCKLVKPGNIEELERAVSEVISDPDYSNRIGARARQTVVDHLSWQKYVERLESMIQEIISR